MPPHMTEKHNQPSPMRRTRPGIYRYLGTPALLLPTAWIQTQNAETRRNELPTRAWPTLPDH